MASPKVGEATRASIMSLVREYLVSKGFDVLQVASGSFGIPSVENGEETAVRIVFQVPKGGREDNGYDVFEEAEAYKAKCANDAIKAQKRAEEKAKKLAKKKEG